MKLPGHGNGFTYAYLKYDTPNVRYLSLRKQCNMSASESKTVNMDECKCQNCEYPSDMNDP